MCYLCWGWHSNSSDLLSNHSISENTFGVNIAFGYSSWRFANIFRVLLSFELFIGSESLKGFQESHFNLFGIGRRIRKRSCPCHKSWFYVGSFDMIFLIQWNTEAQMEKSTQNPWDIQLCTCLYIYWQLIYFRRILINECIHQKWPMESQRRKGLCE